MRKSPTDSILRITARLEQRGISAEMQRKIGIFVVVWGLFETNLEPTLWALLGEKVEGRSPSTEKKFIGDWIKVMQSCAIKFSSRPAQRAFHKAAEVAENLLEYRNAIIHGWLIGSGSSASFIRNPTWSGEHRRRTTSVAHIDENLLNMAIDSAWVLYEVVFKARSANAADSISALKSDIDRAWSQSGELRHLPELMNHEKY